MNFKNMLLQVMLSYSCSKFQESYTPPAARIRVNSICKYIQSGHILAKSNLTLTCSKRVTQYILEKGSVFCLLLTAKMNAYVS
jgi:hypothetical protein